MFVVGTHDQNFLTLFDLSVIDTYQSKGTQIVVEPAVVYQCFGRGVFISFGSGNAIDDGIEQFFDPQTGFGTGFECVGTVESDSLLYLLFDTIRFGGGEVDFVDDGNEFEIILEGDVDIGDSLCFDALGSIDDQQCAFTRCERAAHFIGKIDMTRSVDQVEGVDFSLFFVLKPNALRFYRDAALFFDIHRIHHLCAHLTIRYRAALLNETICERTFSVVDMGNYREVAYIFLH